MSRAEFIMTVEEAEALWNAQKCMFCGGGGAIIIMSLRNPATKRSCASCYKKMQNLTKVGSKELTE